MAKDKKEIQNPETEPEKQDGRFKTTLVLMLISFLGGLLVGIMFFMGSLKSFRYDVQKAFHMGMVTVVVLIVICAILIVILSARHSKKKKEVAERKAENR